MAKKPPIKLGPIGPWTLQCCEHRDESYNSRGWYELRNEHTGILERIACRKPAKCGAGPDAPYGWCCDVCEPVMEEMFGGPSEDG